MRLRVYAERPRRVERLLEFTSRWGERPHIIQGDRIVASPTAKRGRGEGGRAGDAPSRARESRVHPRLQQPGLDRQLLGVPQVGAVPVLANAWWSDTALRMRSLN